MWLGPSCPGYPFWEGRHALAALAPGYEAFNTRLKKFALKQDRLRFPVSLLFFGLIDPILKGERGMKHFALDVSVTGPKSPRDAFRATRDNRL